MASVSHTDERAQLDHRRAQGGKTVAEVGAKADVDEGHARALADF